MLDLDKQIWRFYGNIFIFFKIKNLQHKKCSKTTIFTLQLTSSKITEEDLVEHWKFTQIFLKHYWSFLQIELENNDWSWQTNLTILWEHFHFFQNKKSNTKNVPKQQFLHYIDFFKNYRGRLGRTLKIDSDILETLLKLPANWTWEQWLILTNKFDDFMGTFSFFSKLKIFLTQKMFQKKFLHYSDFFKNHRGRLGRTLKIYSDILETLLKLPANWSWEQCLILTNKFDDFMGTFSFFSK